MRLWRGWPLALATAGKPLSLATAGKPLALATALAAALAGCDAGAPPQPAAGGDRVERIVLVTIDTLRADRVGAYGDADAETPALDAFAAEGVRFETAISPAPLTLPSHATLLTGRDPPRHGVRHNGVFRLGADVPSLAEHLRASGFATAAFVSAFVLDRRFGLERGFDHYDDALGLLKGTIPGVASRRGDLTVDAANAWLASAPERFFLWLHLYDPHAPHGAPEPFGARFEGREYEGDIAFADAQLGRLRAALEARWPGGTLWWLTSDHGESLGEHRETTHSYTIYEATQRVPLIVAGPGVPRGGTVTGVAALADVAPTLLELAGLPPLPGASGSSLVAAVRGGGASPRASAWMETLATQLDVGWSPLYAVRTGNDKYVRAPEPELYDLAADPGELANLAAERPGRAAELDRMIEQELAAGLPIVPSFAPDAAERAQLEALGYLRGAEGPSGGVPLGQVGGPDPKREVGGKLDLDEIAVLLNERRGPEALAAYDRIEKPGYGLRVLGANAALLSGDLDRAEREAQRAIALAELPEPWLVIAKAQLQRGQPAEARRSIERALALDGDKAEAWTWLGAIAEDEGDTEEAIRMYEKARSLPSVSPHAFWRLAALHIEGGRLDAARAALAEIPQAELRMPEATFRLARAERAAGRIELARTRVDGALRDFPHVADLWLLKGELLDESGDLRAALAARRSALQLEPQRADLQNAVAWSLGRLGRNLVEADSLAAAALGSAGRKPPLLDTLATIRTAQGRYAEALALAGEGLRAAEGSDRVDLLFRRAEALAGLGRKAEAAEALAEARRAAEGRPPAWNTWDEAERRAQRLLAAAA
jgi:arylsulfatase A-like enzyme/Tfp pilus assembly protein PilF